VVAFGIQDVREFCGVTGERLRFDGKGVLGVQSTVAQVSIGTLYELDWPEDGGLL
jgi:hypothetical protein